MKSNKAPKLAIFFLLLCQFTVHAQISNEQDVFKALPERFVYQVKQLDQFINRFNSDENQEGIRVNAGNASQDDREKILASLFNLEQMDQANFKKKALKFIKEVTGSRIQSLSFYDKDYYATVDCQVLFNNKRETLTLTLVLEGDAENGSHWSIKGAKANFLNIKPIKRSKEIIPPTNHEVDFVELLEVFNGSHNINDYVSSSHEPDQLDILCYAIKKEEVKMISTTMPTYHFLEIPGWIFTVDFFNRKSKNSGWLISNLQNVDKSGLEKYKAEKLFILQ